jgi:MFS family permease
LSTNPDFMSQNSMTSGERRVAFSMAGIFSARMLGLFMIVPVFVDYAKELSGYTVTLAGLAIGIYGLSQALLQIPLGMLSDRIGRKPVIIGGLLVFALGSVVAALSTSIAGVILGRALQGSGAIASAVLALTADLTREEQRIKVMAFIGISIGVSFALAMVLGPVLHYWVGLSGIFWIIALLALVGIGILILLVPTPVVSRFHRDTQVEADWLRHAVRNVQLLRLDFGIFTLHAILMATFVVVPGLLHGRLGLAAGRDWVIYLPTMLAGMALIVPFIILAEKKRMLKQVFVGAVALLAVAELGLASLGGSMVGMVIMLLLFFAAFNLLEAMLPSLVARLAPAAHKGTAMGVYSSSQFMGVFAGGTVGGWLLEHSGAAGVFIAGAGMSAVWLLLALSMQKPGYLSTQLLNGGTLDKARAQQMAEALSRVAGVEEATVIGADGVAYLKVDKRTLDVDSLRSFSIAGHAA